jgi:hypothetical protein
MRRAGSLVAFIAVLVIGVQGAAAARSSSHHARHAIGGIVPSHLSHGGIRTAFRRTSNLVYHSGGSVQTASPRKTYAIFWGASFGTGYQSLIDQYFGDVGHDSGQNTNVYANNSQYYQTIGGTTTYIPYNQAFGASWS